MLNRPHSFHKQVTAGFIGALLSIATLPLLRAQTISYVDDTLTITVRTGKGSEYQILRTISSGTPVEVLQTDADGYKLIRLKDGVEGWVRSQYLVDNPIARDRLAEAETRLEQLKEENARLQVANNASQQEKAGVDEDLTLLTQNYEELNRKYAELRALAAEPEAMKEENKALNQEIETLKRSALELREQNNLLTNRSEQNWFLAGAGVLLGGMLIGLILPRVRWRRKSSWDQY